MRTRSFALLFVSAYLASAAGAQMSLVSQDRRIELAASAYAGGFQPGPPDLQSLTVVAPDAGAFDELRTISAQTPDSWGQATAEIHSSLAPDRIVWSGSGSAAATSTSNIPARGIGDASSTTTVVFSLAETCTYALQGSLWTNSTNGHSAHVRLFRDTTMLVNVQQTSPGTMPVSLSGVLAPGLYRLELSAAGYSTHGYDYTADSDTTLQADFRVVALHAPFCFGDGTGTACPCGNSSPAGAEAGCLNSLGQGGALRATGMPSLANDTLVLQGAQMTNGSALYFQGTTQSNGGGGAVFGDGKRCASGTIARLGTKTNAAGASQYPDAADASISVRGGVGTPGTRTYQVWYRNVALFCTADGFNLTNGVAVEWQP